MATLSKFVSHRKADRVSLFMEKFQNSYNREESMKSAKVLYFLDSAFWQPVKATEFQWEFKR